jgi:ABC-type transporter Mla subunit MlaD
LNLVDIVVQLKNERDRIDQAIAALDGASGDTNGTVRKGSPTRKGGMSAEGRRRLSEMMKKRWAERKKKAAIKGTTRRSKS